MKFRRKIIDVDEASATVLQNSGRLALFAANWQRFSKFSKHKSLKIKLQEMILQMSKMPQNEY